jgi:hypothetical protein
LTLDPQLQITVLSAAEKELPALFAFATIHPIYESVFQVGGHLYGTSLRAVSEIRNAGKICVMHIDLAGEITAKMLHARLAPFGVGKIERGE